MSNPNSHHLHELFLICLRHSPFTANPFSRSTFSCFYHRELEPFVSDFSDCELLQVNYREFSVQYYAKPGATATVVLSFAVSQVFCILRGLHIQHSACLFLSLILTGIISSTRKYNPGHINLSFQLLILEINVIMCFLRLQLSMQNLISSQMFQL